MCNKAGTAFNNPDIIDDVLEDDEPIIESVDPSDD